MKVTGAASATPAATDTLLEYLETHTLPWIHYDPYLGRLVFTIDNYLLSDYRACPAHFMLAHVEGYHQKGAGVDVKRSWPLDFGILFHKMMEVYYKTFREPGFDLNAFAIQKAADYWQEMDMNVHMQHKESQSIGGYPGFAGMLVQYATQFKAENERLRILASEVSFGRNKEVPLYTDRERYFIYKDGSDRNPFYPFYPFDVYLSGRIDIIADDGFRIIPLDHKTMGSFRGDPLERFLVDEGPVGYIYAMKKVLPTIIPEGPELLLKRDCNRISMNLISKSVPKEGSRFRRMLVYKSDSQLEQYRWRQVQTCKNLLSDLDLYIRGIDVPRDTKSCQNWFFRTCDFYDVHRQQDHDGEVATLHNGFIKLPLWNTENIQPVE